MGGDEGSSVETLPAKATSFQSVMVLAPMVRISTLPLRLLSLEQGADLVWTEEMVAKKVAPCQRVENPRLGTIEYYDKASPWMRVWQTHPLETARLVFQIGASTPEDAVAAAKVVEQDVAAFCLNMGCPKEFSVKNGMGAALLKAPATASAIIQALKRATPLPVVAKIRMKSTLEETKELMLCLQAAGVDAITVHVRYVSQRSSEPAHRCMLRALVEAVSVPVLGNGDVVDFEDAKTWREESGCAGVMVARMAAENPSCFRAGGRVPQAEMLRAHMDKCVEFEEPHQNIKYYYNHFFSAVCVPGSALFDNMSRAKSRRDMAALLGRAAYYDSLERARGCGGAVEEAGWWKGHKV